MTNLEKNRIIMMDFSGVYKQESFYKEEKISWVEVQDLTGTNCYCDDDAKTELQKRIEEFPAEGIHFIDSGNYHYMSRIWLEKIKEPFCLLVFDNHTDMQLPAFGGILSCGGWIAAALEELPNLQEVVLVGPDEEAFSQVEPELQKKVHFLSREMLLKECLEEKLGFFAGVSQKYPIYISVDKDVLCLEDASTTWSQGDMRLEELQEYLQVVMDSFETNKQRIIGMDVCGECDPDVVGDHGRNDVANDLLLQLWKRRFT